MSDHQVKCLICLLVMMLSIHIATIVILIRLNDRLTNVETSDRALWHIRMADEIIQGGQR